MYGIDFINEISHPTQLHYIKDKIQVLHNIKISIKTLAEGWISPNGITQFQTVKHESQA